LAANMGLLQSSISPALLDAQKTMRQVPGKPNAYMGLTWHIRRTPHATIISKNGGIVGYQSYMAFIPGQVGVIAMANTQRPDRKLDTATQKLLMEVAGLLKRQ